MERRVQQDRTIGAGAQAIAERLRTAVSPRRYRHLPGAVRLVIALPLLLSLVATALTRGSGQTRP